MLDDVASVWIAPQRTNLIFLVKYILIFINDTSLTIRMNDLKNTKYIVSISSDHVKRNIIQQVDCEFAVEKNLSYKQKKSLPFFYYSALYWKEVNQILRYILILV